MIEWIEYDRNSRAIKSHVDHLVTDGVNVWVAEHAKNINGEGYVWYEGIFQINESITHWAKINLPKGDKVE